MFKQKLKQWLTGYILVAGFQAQVQESSESAKLALATVPDIENQVREVENTVRTTENVRIL